jgi:hypothetical protein
MYFIKITVGKGGVGRVDVYALDAPNYNEAKDFHDKLAPAIERLDRDIKGMEIEQKIH